MRTTPLLTDSSIHMPPINRNDWKLSPCTLPLIIVVDSHWPRTYHPCTEPRLIHPVQCEDARGAHGRY